MPYNLRVAESMRARWQRLDPPVQLRPDQLTTLIQPAFPGQTVIASQLLEGGRANTNLRLLLSDQPEPVLLRLCTRAMLAEEDVPPSVVKEAALHRLLAPRLPVPRVYFAAQSNPATGHPYLLREWAAGERLEVVWDRLDPTDLLALAHEIGVVLAGIHSVRFPQAGFLDDHLSVTPFPPTLSGGLVDFLGAVLGEQGKQRLGPEQTRALFAFAERENFYGAGWTVEPMLVHADYGGSNIIVSTDDGPPRVSAVVDWEFAFSSGSPFIDFGNLLRPPFGDLSVVADAVAAGYRAAGGQLPDDWRRRARYEDLLSWAGFLGRPQLPETVAEDARQMIVRTLAE